MKLTADRTPAAIPPSSPAAQAAFGTEPHSSPGLSARYLWPLWQERILCSLRAAYPPCCLHASRGQLLWLLIYAAARFWVVTTTTQHGCQGSRRRPMTDSAGQHRQVASAGASAHGVPARVRRLWHQHWGKIPPGAMSATPRSRNVAAGDAPVMPSRADLGMRRPSAAYMRDAPDAADDLVGPGLADDSPSYLPDLADDSPSYYPGLACPQGECAKLLVGIYLTHRREPEVKDSRGLAMTPSRSRQAAVSSSLVS